ncbi:HAMP domain-containing sensor histidine kinase [Bacillus mycoides]|uniref:HAMP domain-containing sensor histidine kinase n=1 Tax=Bacillus mycoides TaxID=1405 RepID=UPI003829309E
MKRKKSLLSSLIIQYVVVIITAILSSVGCIAYIYMSFDLLDIEAEPISPQEVIQSDYRNIQADAILKKSGWVEIIKDERIVYTIGKKKDNITTYGMENLDKLIANSYSDYELNIARFTGTDGETYYCIVKIPTEEYFFTAVHNSYAALKKSVPIAILFFFVVNGFVIYLFIRKFSKPLKILQNGIKDITEEELYTPLKFNSYREIEDVKHVFNHMVHALNAMNKERRENEERKKRMLCDISHDIRTPMTSIIGYSKALMEKQLTQKEKKLFLSYICRKSLQLEQLIENLFHFAKLDSPSYKLQLQRENFVEFIKEIIVIFYGEIEEKEINLNLELPNYPLYLNFDKQQMERAIGNIIVNAVKYNPNRTTLSIALRDEDERIIIEITDNGIGMSQEIANCIFQEFIRGDKARNSDGGSGLGLAISKRIIELHEGNITVDSTLNKGTTFSIILLKSIFDTPTPKGTS